ncbi:MAG: hypothetical protein ACOC4D_00035 [Bacteroidota bacterium]
MGSLKIGDRVASDDYCAIGILIKQDGKLFVEGDFGKVEYLEIADWQPYEIWKERLDKGQKRVGFWKKIFG